MTYFIFICLVFVIVCYIIASAKADFYKGKYDETNKKLFNEIEQLDDYVGETTNNTSVKKVMIPDSVNIKEPTLKSTQDEDCKQYTISTNNRPVKTVIGKANNNINNAIENNDNSEEDDGPIKNL